MDRKIKVKRIYKHFKGKLYYIEDVAIDSETLEEVVVYRALYDDYKLYIRSLDMFLSYVDYKKYPEHKSKYRFTLMEDQ